jgi:acyl carrier protein
MNDTIALTTLERLQALLAKDFDLPLDQLRPEARLEDLDIDSLRMIEILFSVEETFAITVATEQSVLKEQLQTLGDLAAHIDALVVEQHAASRGKAAS